VRREAAAAAAIGCVVAAVLMWAGPPGSDTAAHVFQRQFLLDHGFGIWNNFWYAGRYTFVTYSLAYYPIAALVGIRPLALVSVAIAAYAFSTVAEHQWGRAARWPGRAFAVAWGAAVLSGAFPFLAAAAAALVALRLLQAQRRGWAAAAILLTLALSPLAFALLAIVLAGQAVARRRSRTELVVPAVAIATGIAIELVLWRLFPDGGHYPFPVTSFLAVCTFCLFGLGLTWRVRAADGLRGMFAAYLLASFAAFAVPSAIGENVTRLRYAAVPLILLALALRRWRPLPVSLVAIALATSWNVTPLAFSFAHSATDPSANVAYWQPAIRFLHRKLTPSYRVEAVDTASHWEATFLPGAGIPLARGWYRQDDFPANTVLYSPFGRHAYLNWLRHLAVRYVVLSDATPDYSSAGEARLLRSGHSGLRPVFHSRHLVVYAVPTPAPIIRPASGARVLQLTPGGLRLRAARAGRYDVAVRYSAYWHANDSCIRPGPDGMTQIIVRRPATIDLDLNVTAEAALSALVGLTSHCPANAVSSSR
jgi:hypothetical protein